MWDDLSNGIVATLQDGIDRDVVAGVKSASIYDYEPGLTTAYPAISVVPSDSPAKFADTQRNQRTYTFSIKCLQERKEFGAQKAERVQRQLVDELLTLFDSSRYLYGDQLQGRGYVEAAPSRWAYIQTEQVDVRMAEILLACVVIQ